MRSGSDVETDSQSICSGQVVLENDMESNANCELVSFIEYFSRTDVAENDANTDTISLIEYCSQTGGVESDAAIAQRGK